MPLVTTAAGALWTSLGLPEKCLEYLNLKGDSETAVDSSFCLGAAAQAAISCSALSVAHLVELNGGKMQTVSADARHAVVECASERFYQLDGKAPPPPWDPLAGAYRTKDGWVRIHTNFPHHREGILQLLKCAPTREAVAAALSAWSAEEFESVASERGMCVAALRTFEQWDAHPQAMENLHVPPVELVRIGGAPPANRRDVAGQPLAGIRVLELTRVLAGPTCGRALAGRHGADVLWITSPNLPALPALDVDTSRGKRTAQLDLTSSTDRDRLTQLAQETDVFLQSYRPDALASKGFGPSDLAKLRPGIVYAQLNAYGWRGPWRGRRGFDSLVQTATGFNVAEASAFGQTVDPRPLPFQALDHIAGYMLALGIGAALCKRITEGGSWEVRVSLAGVGRWIRSLGRLPVTPLMRPLPQPGSAEAEAYLELWEGATADERTRGRQLRAVRRAARLGDGEVQDEVRYAPLKLDVHTATWDGERK